MIVIDQDTQAVIDRLDTAVSVSSLSLRRFAHALGTSPSRLSSYRTGRVAPSAAFLIRAERIGGALRQARRDSIPTILDAMEDIRRADSKGDDDWTYALALEARDRLRDTLRHHRPLAATWEIQPPANMAHRWKTLIAAFVSHEFITAGLPAPPWSEGLRLDTEWVLDTPRVSNTEIKHQTPGWLAERNIFIAEKDLVTL